MSATPRQLAFIESLLTERDVPTDTVTQIRLLAAHPDAAPRVEISQAIDALLRRPKKAVARAARPAAAGDVFDGVEDAKYAVPAGRVPAGIDLHGNDHLFVEVRTYRGRRYMRRLTGAPGSFSRSKLPWAGVQDLLREIRPNGLAYSQKFGDLYSCCGVCGAELTDETSRALKLGPVCRGRFGL